MATRKLYRYQPCEAARIGGINAAKIWVSNPSTFNDSTDLNPCFKDDFNGPFKNAGHLVEIVTALFRDNPEIDGFWLFGDSNDQSSPAYILKNAAYHGNFQETFAEALVRRIKTFGVTCFADSPTLTLMWAHYAKSGSGFCLEYDFQNSMSVASRHSIDGFSIIDVDYSSSHRNAYLIEEAIFAPRRTAQRMLATKSIDWSIERETRLISFNQGNHCYVDMPAGLTLTKIIAGCAIDSANADLLKEKAKTLGIAFSQSSQS